MTDSREDEAMAALREHTDSKKTHGQKALVWRVADGVNVLAVHGEALTFDDPETAIEELLVWNDDKPSAAGLWLWEGWAYVTEGSYEHGRHDSELVIGGEFRRLNAWEAYALRKGRDVFAAKSPELDKRSFTERVDASRAAYAAEQGLTICTFCNKEIVPGQDTRAGQVHWDCWEKTQ